MAKPKESRYVSEEQVRQNAKESGMGRSFLTIPDNASGTWEPEKSGTFEIDIIPYEVTIDNHPDGVPKGKLWFKYPFQIHKDVGPANDWVVCPVSIGKPCYICEQRKILSKQRGFKDETVKSLTPQSWVAYSILDPEDADKGAVFAMSKGKFANALEDEIKQGDDSIAGFYRCSDAGRTLKVRFKDEVFNGNKYLEADRIDFNDRGELDEDETLAKAPCLDDLFGKVLSYNALKALHLQLPTEGEDTTEDPEAGKGGKGKGGKSGSSTSGKGGKGKTPEAKYPVGTEVEFKNPKNKKQLLSGVVDEVDGTGDYTVNVNGKTYADLDEAELSEVTGDSGSDSGSGEDWTPKSGDRVIDSEKRVGTVTKYDAKTEDAAYTTDEGEKLTADKDDLKPAPEKESKGKGGKSGGKGKDADKLTCADFSVGQSVKNESGDEGVVKQIIPDKKQIVVKYPSGNTIEEPHDLTPIEGGEAGEAVTFEVGDEVTWDDGTEEGEIVKLIGDDVAKIKTAEGFEKKDLTDLAKKEEKPKGKGGKK